MLSGRLTNKAKVLSDDIKTKRFSYFLLMNYDGAIVYEPIFSDEVTKFYEEEL